MKGDPSKEYIEFICRLYGDSYDDREEDSSPGGLDWKPGQKAQHKSLGAFKKELEEQGIILSTSKILKILISGRCWSTERTREAGLLYETLTTPVADGGEGLEKKDAVKRIAEELEISEAMVYMSLPFMRTVYDLEDKTSNAKRCDRWRERQSTHPDLHTSAVAALRDHRNQPDELLCLWKYIISFEGASFTTSGRGSRPGVEFKYEVSKPGGKSGRRYRGEDVSGYGNELWIIVDGEKRGKSISRSTVDLAYKNGLALMEAEGAVKGPKALRVPGAGSYLFPILVRFGVISG